MSLNLIDFIILFLLNVLAYYLRLYKWRRFMRAVVVVPCLAVSLMSMAKIYQVLFIPLERITLPTDESFTPSPVKEHLLFEHWPGLDIGHYSEEETTSFCSLDDMKPYRRLFFVHMSGNASSLSPLQVCGLEAASRQAVNVNHPLIVPTLVTLYLGKAEASLSRVRAVYESIEVCKLHSHDILSQLSIPSAVTWYGKHIMNADPETFIHRQNILSAALAYQHGGTVLPLDVLLTSPYLITAPLPASVVNNSGVGEPLTTYLRYTPGHPFLKELLLLMTDDTQSASLLTGAAMTKAEKRCGDRCDDITFLAGGKVLHPTPDRAWREMFKSGSEKIPVRDTQAIHLHLARRCSHGAACIERDSALQHVMEEVCPETLTAFGNELFCKETGDTCVS